MMEQDDEGTEEYSQLQPEMMMLYKDRLDWKDVKPIYNSAEENAVCRIATTEECN